MKKSDTRRDLKASASGLIWRVTALATATMLATLSGCADFSGITAQAQRKDARSLNLPLPGDSATRVVDAAWWRAFDDDTLNQLVTQALQANPSLKLAQARVASAQAATALTQASASPQAAAQLSLTEQRYTAHGAVPPPLAGAVKASGSLGLVGSWELDFFGKNSAALQAALGTERAALADAQAARTLLAAQVAQTYLGWVGLNEQRGLVNRTLAQRTQWLQLVQDRTQAGLDTPLELRQAQAALPDARLQLAQLDLQLALTRNALAALIGKPNEPLALVPKALAAIESMNIESTLPANLLGQRADVAAARWRVQAADQGVESSRAHFYPNINLSAFAGLSSIGLGQLLQPGSQQWGVGPAISLPVFDAGRLRAHLGGKTAERDAAVESYNAVVINAVREVLDQLTSAQAIAGQQAEQAQAEQAAQDTYAAAQQRYAKGLLNALQVLNAESAVLAQRRQSVALRTLALQNQVALAHALGGGFTEPATLLD